MSLVFCIDCSDGTLLATDSCMVGHDDDGRLVSRRLVKKIRRIGSHHLWATTGASSWQMADSPRVDLCDVDIAAESCRNADDVARALSCRFATVTTEGALAKTEPSELLRMFGADRKEHQRLGNQVLAVSNGGGVVSRAACSVDVDLQQLRAVATQPSWDGNYCFLGVDVEKDATQLLGLRWLALPWRQRLRRRPFSMREALSIFADCVDLRIANENLVDWPIQAAFVTPESIQLTEIASREML